MGTPKTVFVGSLQFSQRRALSDFPNGHFKVCKIKGKIKEGCEPFPDWIKDSICQGKPLCMTLKSAAHPGALVRTRNAEFNHPRLQSRPFHAEPGCCTQGTTDDPS